MSHDPQTCQPMLLRHVETKTCPLCKAWSGLGLGLRGAFWALPDSVRCNYSIRSSRCETYDRWKPNVTAGDGEDTLMTSSHRRRMLNVGQCLREVSQNA